MRLLTIFILFLSSSLLSQVPVSVVEGYLDVYHPNDNNSTYIGFNSGRSVLPAPRFNTFLGYFSGFSNTSGQLNTFVGSGVATSNTTGSDNSIFGAQAGRENTTGKNNSFFGANAGYENIAGSYNTYLGTEVGYSNTVGQKNTFVGYQSGYMNITGSNNTFIGYQSGYKNLSTQNAYVGYQSGKNNTTGFANSFFGYNSGISNSTGTGNTYIGNSTGFLASTGENNTLLGASSGGNITTGDGNVCLGYTAGPTSNQSNRLYIDNETTNTPLIFGRFDTDLVTINGSFQLGPTNHFNGDDGLIVGPSLPGADIFIAANDAVIIEIGDLSTQDGNFQVWNGALPNNDINRVLIDLDETGNLEIKGTLNQGSDFNRKENIVKINSSEILHKIKNLPISEWQYKGKNIRHIGPMAQDFYEAFGLGQGETTIATVDADGVALAAIKALAEKNARLEKENTQILHKLEELEKLVLLQFQD